MLKRTSKWWSQEVRYYPGRLHSNHCPRIRTLFLLCVTAPLIVYRSSSLMGPRVLLHSDAFAEEECSFFLDPEDPRNVVEKTSNQRLLQPYAASIEFRRHPHDTRRAIVPPSDYIWLRSSRSPDTADAGPDSLPPPPLLVHSTSPVSSTTFSSQTASLPRYHPRRFKPHDNTTDHERRDSGWTCDDDRPVISIDGHQRENGDSAVEDDDGKESDRKIHLL